MPPSSRNWKTSGRSCRVSLTPMSQDGELAAIRNPATLIGEAKAIVLSRLLDQEFDR